MTVTESGFHGYVSISAESHIGLLRGLETFSQLVYLSKSQLGFRVSMYHGYGQSNFVIGDFQFQINLTSITDGPRFSYRGILLDTGRHYLPVPVLLQHLDLMEISKMNVLHWHITDDESFPFVSERFPNLR